MTENAIALAVGPEGGWTDDELHLFQQNGWISASLGHDNPPRRNRRHRRNRNLHLRAKSVSPCCSDERPRSAQPSSSHRVIS